MSLRARLCVDLSAIVSNWCAIDALTVPDCETAAVVKADAYGCGAETVGRALARSGVQTFFVALPEEGVRLRKAIGAGPQIYVLGGYGRDQIAHYRRCDLRPVLNSVDQARNWFDDCPGAPSAVQIDTGMNRLGMEPSEFRDLGPLPPSVCLIMSHMGCSDMPSHPMSRTQLRSFLEMTAGLDVPRSLSATSGTLLGEDFHFDLTRIGIGLYGGWPFEAAKPVVTVEAPVIQVRELETGETIGYGATWVAERPSRIATISAGYADGLIRAMGNAAKAYIDGQAVPFAGRVSMDLITLDVTDCDCTPGDMIELLGPHQSIDALASAAGTIGHEILTAIGSRYEIAYTSA